MLDGPWLSSSGALHFLNERKPSKSKLIVLLTTIAALLGMAQPHHW
jgi:hypothetical protein